MLGFFSLCTFLGLVFFLAYQSLPGDPDLVDAGQTLWTGSSGEYSSDANLRPLRMVDSGFQLSLSNGVSGPDPTKGYAKMNVESNTDFDDIFGNGARAAGSDAPPVTVSFEVDSYTVAEGATATVKIILSQAPERILTIPLSTSRQQGITVDDYSGVPGSVSFGASDTESTFTFSATQDHIDDDGEGLRISFGSSLPTGVTSVSPVQTIVHISDDDAAGVTVDPTAMEVLEGKSSSYTVVLDSQPTHEVTIRINPPSGTEILTLPSRLTFTTNNWNIDQPVTVIANPDRDKVNDSGTITHSVDSLDSNYDHATPSDVAVTVIDDDVIAVTVSFAQSSYLVAEGSTASVEIILSDDPQRTVTIPITRTDESGATSTDYSGIPDSVTFNAGDTRRAFTLSALSDDVDDDGESVKLGFGTLPNGVASGTMDETTISIADDDLPLVTTSFEQPMYSVEEGMGVSVKLELSAAPERTVTIPITRTDQGGATSTDYSGVPDSIVFSPSDTERSFRFFATQDSLNDDGESVRLTFGDLQEGVTVGIRSEATVSIIDDDVPSITVSFEQAQHTVEEGATTTVRISLSVDPERTVTVALVKTPQGGIALDDYSGVPESIAFDSGETERSFTFSATADDIDDDGEGLLLSFGAPLPPGITAETPDQTMVHITDDDMVGVMVEPNMLSVAERATTSYTVVLESQPTHDVTLTINSPAGAKLVIDKPRLMFTAINWDKPQRVTVTANPDSDTDDYEATITHSINSRDGKYDRVAPGQVVVKVIDIDVPAVAVSFEEAIYEVPEGSTTTVKVLLNEDPERMVTIPITKTDLGGASGTDYSGVPPSILFNAGDTDKSFTFTAIDDSEDDDGKSVLLTFGALPDGVTRGVTDQATMSIVDNDVPSVAVSFYQAAYSVAEGATKTIKVVLDRDPERTVTIPVNSMELGGATSADYSGVPASITFNAGDTEKAFTFAATGDALDDDGESVLLTFDALPDGVTQGVRDQATVSIIDDDVPSVTVSFEQLTYTVAEGATTTIKVMLSADPERTLTIPITKTDLGGASGTDYSGIPASIVFNAGDTEKSFTFTAIDDALDDDGESVLLTFGALPDGVTRGVRDQATVSITDDDVPLVAVSFYQGAYSVAEGATATITVMLSADPERTVTLPIIKMEQGGATSTDYLGVPSSIAFNAGDTEKSFTFAATADALDDDGESVVLTFGALPDGVTAGSRSEASVSIIDDDVPSVTVSFYQVAYSIAEGATTTIKVMLSADPERTVTIPITKTDLGGASGTDYSGIPSSIVFNAGDTDKSFTFAARADALDDDGESVVLTFGALPDGVTAGSRSEASVSIIDDDVPSVTVSFYQVAYSIAEGATTTIKVMLSADPERTVTIPITKTDLGGASGTDYSGIPSSIVFDAGDTDKSFTFAARADALDDDGESVVLTFGALPDGVTAGSRSEASVSIIDDDVPSVTVSFYQVAYSVAEGATTTIRVVLDNDPERTVTIPITRTNLGGAIGTDYSGVPNSLVFNAGDLEKAFTFAATADALDDDGESVLLTFDALPDGVTQGVRDQATVSIIDDDMPSVTVSFEQLTYTVAEGATTTIKVMLSADPERTMTIPITKTDLGGASGTDYSGIPASIVFNAGDTEKSFTFTAIDDSEDDDGESVKLTFGALPDGVTRGVRDQATVSITDDDVPQVTVSFEQLTYTVAEGATTTIKVMLSADPERAVTLPITKMELGGATSADYSGVPSSVVFNTGDTEKSFTFAATADALDDDGESVLLTFDALPDGVTRGVRDHATVSIVDDDVPSVSISFEQAGRTVAEGATTTIKVVLDKDPERTVTIPVNSMELGGATSADYSGVPNSLVFNAGDLEKAFTFAATADALDDDGESVLLTFGPLPDGVAAGAWNETTVSIADDDVPLVSVSFDRTEHSVAEGATTSVKVALDQDPERTVAIPITRTHLGGATVTDYSGVPDGLLFNAGDTEKAFVFSAIQDSVDDDGESVLLTLGALPEGVAVGARNKATVSILDDDVPFVSVSFEQAVYTVEEGATTTVRVSLSADPERTVIIDLDESPRGGIALDEYSGVPESITFGPGETERSFTFSATGDDIDDDGEGLLLSFGSPLPSGVTAEMPTQTTVHITDDDMVGVTVAPRMLTVVERATTSYTVVLDSQPTHDVTITINSPAGAKLVTDKPRLTFAATSWNLPQRVTVTANRDSDTDDYEGTITHSIDSRDSKYDRVMPGQVAVSVIDNDVPSVAVSFRMANYSVLESSTTTVNVALDRNPERTVTIPINSLGMGGATSADYSGVPDSVVFNAGDTEKAFTFSATADAFDDDGESVLLTFGALPDGVAAGSRSEASVSIIDDDVPSVTVSFEQAAYMVAEGATATMKVMLSADPERTVTISISSTELNGATSTDYSGVPATIEFNAGDTEKTFTFSAVQDLVDDDGESVLLTFDALPDRVTAGLKSEASVSIIDDDVPTVAVSFERATYTVEEGGTSTINVVLDKDPERTVTIPITRIEQGGATSADYSGVPDSVVFRTGDTEKTFTFTAIGDALDDDGESVKLTFGALPDGVAATARSQAAVSIVDNDVPSVVVSFELAIHTVQEGATSTIRVVLDKDPERTVTIPITRIEQGGATSADYAGIPDSVVFRTGDTEKTFTFTAIGDALDDDGEAVLISFGNLAEGVTAGTRSEATVSIIDDDVPSVTVSFEQAAYTVEEGATTTVRVGLSADPERTVTIDLDKSPQGGIALDDYSGVPESITFDSGKTEHSFTFSATGDDIDDDREGLLLSFGSPLPSGVTAEMPTQTTVHITDDDMVGVTVAPPMLTVVERATTSYTVVLDSQPTHDVTITINSPAGAKLVTDKPRLTFAATTWDTPQTVTVTANPDSDTDDYEGTITHSIDSSDSKYDGVVPGQVVVKVIDNDVPLVAASFERAAYSVAEGATTTVKVVLDRDPERTVTISITRMEQGGATSTDYSGVPESAVFNTGETETTFIFSAIQDLVDDDGESIGLAFGDMPDAVTEGTTRSTVVSIVDDDVAGVLVDPADLPIDEGATSTYLIVLQSQPRSDVTVTINSPADNSHVTTSPNHLTFTTLSWNTEQSVAVSARHDDDADDNNATVTHTVASMDSAYGGFVVSAVRVMVTDDDEVPVTVSFDQGSYSVKEGSTSTVRLILNKDPERTFTIPIDKLDQGGATGADYSGVPASLEFNAGDTEKSFPFSATRDSMDDDGESVRLSFGDLPDRVSLGLHGESTVSITDEDLPSVVVSFELATYSAEEGGTTTIKVVVDRPPERSIAVPIMRTDLGSTTRTDYSGVPDSITFSPFDIEKSFTFSATQDSLNDDGESVKLTFGALPVDVTVGTRDEAIVSIIDDDVPSVTVSFEQTSYIVVEGATTTVKVILSANPERTITIPLDKSPQGGIALDDYSGVPESITFDSGKTERSFTFSATGDDIDDDGEAILLSFGSPLPSGVTAMIPNQTTVHISDDDMVGVTVTPPMLRVVERATTSYTVVLDSQPTHEVTITINSPTGAKLVTDEPRLSFTAANWRIPQEVTVTANPDTDTDDYEGTIAHTINSRDSKYDSVTPAEVVVRVIDTDVLSVAVSFDLSAYSVEEGATTTVKVVLDKDPERMVAIPITRMEQGGVTEADYSGGPDSIVFNAGDTEKAFTFTAIEDALDDDGESVLLTFGPLPDGIAAGTQNEATVSIVDNDVPSVSVSFEEAVYTVAEGATATITVMLSADPERPVTISISSTELNGATSTDYSGVPETIEFNAGDREKTFTFFAVQDLVDDDGESVLLSISDLPDEVTEGMNGESELRITDDDVPNVNVSFEQASYTLAEGETSTIVVVLDAAPERALAIMLVRALLNGITNDDYSGVPDSVNFNSSSTESYFNFSVTDDEIDDDEEGLTLTFGPILPPGVTAVSPTQTTLHLADNDTAGVSVEPTSLTIAEHSTSSYSVVLESQPTYDVTLSVHTPAGTEVATDKAHLAFDPANWHLPQTVIVTAGADVDTADEEGTITHTISSLDQNYDGTIPSDVAVNVIDDDLPSIVVSFGQATYRVDEGSDVTVEVTLSSDSERSLTIPIEKIHQGGVSSADYAGVPDSVTFNPGDTVVTFSVSTFEDSLNDDFELVKLTFGDLPDGVSVGTYKESAISISDDEEPSVSVTFGSATYSVDEGGDVSIRVALSEDPERTLTIPIKKSNRNGATTRDYSSVPRSLTFHRGETESSFTFTAIQDSLDEGKEAVKLSFGTLPQGVAEGTFSDTTVTIVDDEVSSVTVSFALSNYTVAEGSFVTIKVRLSEDPRRTLVIPIVQTKRNGATGRDYSGVPRGLTFEAGETKKSFTLTAIQDSVDDDGESIELAFEDLPEEVSKGEITATTITIVDDDGESIELAFEDLPEEVSKGEIAATTVTIADDDVSLLTVSFDEDSHTVAEGSTTTIRVVLSAAPESVVNVPIEVSNWGGATSTDYLGVPAYVTFAIGDSETSFVFHATEDTEDDDGETIRLRFGDLSDAIAEGRFVETTISITDVDLPPVTVSFDQRTYSVPEGSTTTVNVVLDMDPIRTLTIPIVIISQSSTSTAENISAFSSVTFEPGIRESSIEFSAKQVFPSGYDESVRLGFGRLPNDVRLGAVATSTILIKERGMAEVVRLSFEKSRYLVAEGSSVTIRLMISTALEDRTTVSVSSNHLDGLSGSDYSGVPANVTFGTGEKETSFTFTAASDNLLERMESVLLRLHSPSKGILHGDYAQTRIFILEEKSSKTLYRAESPVRDCIGNRKTPCVLLEHLSVAGNIVPRYDVDWFQMKLKGNASYLFLLPLNAVDLKVYDGQGRSWLTNVEADLESEGLERRSALFQAPRTGVYFLEVSWPGEAPYFMHLSSYRVEMVEVQLAPEQED